MCSANTGGLNHCKYVPDKIRQRRTFRKPGSVELIFWFVRIFSVFDRITAPKCSSPHHQANWLLWVQYNYNLKHMTKVVHLYFLWKDDWYNQQGNLSIYNRCWWSRTCSYCLPIKDSSNMNLHLKKTQVIKKQDLRIQFAKTINLTACSTKLQTVKLLPGYHFMYHVIPSNSASFFIIETIVEEKSVCSFGDIFSKFFKFIFFHICYFLRTCHL